MSFRPEPDEAQDSLSGRARWLGAGVVLGGVLFQALWLGLPAILISVGLVLSFLLWIGSRWHAPPQLTNVFRLAVVVFIFHAFEEVLNGLPTDLPALFGRTPWTDARFIVFNGVWALAFAAAAIRVTPQRPVAVLIVLFFAVVGGVANGVVHLALVMRLGEYFPGAWTAPLCFVMGVWHLRLLYDPGLRESVQQADRT